METAINTSDYRTRKHRTPRKIWVSKKQIKLKSDVGIQKYRCCTAVYQQVAAVALDIQCIKV